MARALGIGGVFFQSKNPGKLARWYSRCLGFSLAWPTGTVFKPARMPRHGGTVWSAFPASTRYFKPSKSRLMVNFVVDDVDAALTAVVAAGGKTIGKACDYPNGRFGWFMDPDGNKVELWRPAAPRRKATRKKR